MFRACFAMALLMPGDDTLPEPAIGRLVRELCGEHDLTGPHDVVLRHLAGVNQRHRVKGRLSRVQRALAEPWSGAGQAAELLDLLKPAVHTPKAARLEPLVVGMTEWLDLMAADEDAEPPISSAPLADAWSAVLDPAATDRVLLERLSALMGAAHAIIATSLADLDDEERAALFATHGAALEAWYRNHFPGAQVPAEQNEALSDVVGLLLRIDRRALHAAAQVLVRLGEPEFLDGIAKRLLHTPKGDGAVPGAGGDVIAAVGSEPHTRVVLGGQGETTYTGAFALIVDLGGDDTYTRGALVDRPTQLASAIVDVKGKDRYADCGAAIAGVALLIDRSGDDTYQSGRFAQGAASGGFALLLDLQGHDKYTLADYGQGFGFLGSGLLVDLDGNDVREAWAFAQGASFGTGFGALIDGRGDDRYLADLNWPDVYGDSGPNVYHGASQGYSTGLRPAVPGGIAALIDLAGNDRYQAGNFSQGGAYFFSFALLYDGAGDDENLGTRYSQGFGVHQAVGVRWDAGGNDHYATRCAANLGAAWDEGIGWFLEDAGDDVYDEQGSISLGGAANSALAVFIDGGGNDRYASGQGKDTQGGCGDASYYNEPAMGVFLDLGGGSDRYSREDRGDDRRLLDAGVGVFLDVKDRKLNQLLRK